MTTSKGTKNLLINSGSNFIFHRMTYTAFPQRKITSKTGGDDSLSETPSPKKQSNKKILRRNFGVGENFI